MSTVLVTGAGGEVGRGVVGELGRHFDLRLLSLEPASGNPHHIRGDILDWARLREVMTGCDAVLHLAVAPGHDGVYEDDAFNDLRFDVNVKGTFHVFELARRLGIRRVVQVSSLMVVWGHGSKGFVPGDALPCPVGTYALTKSLGESIARHYAELHGLEAIVLRITAPFDPADPTLSSRSLRPQQIPFPELARAFRLALTVPLSQFEIVTLVGESSRRMWDLEPARRVLGYVPQINLDDLGVRFAEPFRLPSPQGKIV